ncbi:TIGR01777 family oxidoreductase [Legionella geestiana]|uniref:TIGR01777 family oxidoreductase n=1 Tax=Legionella geestiana TaxID=45065 RepID=UPI001FEB5E15|nr:TIGR01777 family oxidoreductase [Legionella geestiana]
MMNLLIAGASGFIGTELTNALAKDHQLTVLGRSQVRLQQHFSQSVRALTWDALSGHDALPYDAVINLCGSNIGARRWSATVKDELIASRTMTNQRLIAWLNAQKATPRFLCANAIGIYGAEDKSTVSFDENSPVQTDSSPDFLKQIGLAWQDALKPAADAGMSVTTLRFGVVLKKGKGMLKKLELPYKACLGSILGSGEQSLSWIHHEDVLNAVRFILEHPEASGPFNLTSPNPVTQKEFAKTFAAVLKRPLLLKTPSFFIRALLGEMGEYLLLKGQSVLPKRLLEAGFSFKYPTLEAALRREYA